jgi:D-aminopeptidase
MCHGFKGGIGTASRVVASGGEEFMLGALVQANYGRRRNLTIAGAPVGREISDLQPLVGEEPAGGGSSIIVVVGTDAPLLPHQLKRLARRVPIGIGRVGGYGANSSGDIFIAYSNANPEAAQGTGIRQLNMLSNDLMTPLFEATAQATEEAIINALVAAKTMVGADGNTAYALPHDRLQDILRKYSRLM